MRRKNGNFLIEVIVSLSVIVVVLCLIPNTISNGKLSLLSKYKIYKMNEDLNSVAKELKYNNSYEEIESKLSLDNIKLKYSKEFSNEILESNLFEMKKTLEENNYVKIILIGKEKNFMEIEIEISAEIYGKEKKIKSSILKDRWMDYVYKN